MKKFRRWQHSDLRAGCLDLLAYLALDCLLTATTMYKETATAIKKNRTFIICLEGNLY
jgi:hypothetical protein